MAVEEQTEGSQVVLFAGGSNWNRVGQYLNIPGRTIWKLAFKTKRNGSPPGTVTLTVRKHSDDSVILSKLWGNCIDVPTEEGYIEVEFDSPTFVNEYVKILMEWGGSLGDGSNNLGFYAKISDVKAGEYVVRYVSSYLNTSTWDATYRYTYDLTPPGGGGGMDAAVAVSMGQI